MTQTVKGYAAFDPASDLAPHQFERRDLRDNDVAIDIEYCGVCHSDLHMAKNDFGWTTYPLVPGHEIVGRVKSVGKNVTKVKAGDLVGVGCTVDSCNHCEPCRHDLDQYCKQRVSTYASKDLIDGMPTYGGYSERIVVTEKFVLKVPENLNPAAVAPMLCVGVTAWSPLTHWKVGNGSKVAVVGLGGMGHMAIKLAKALGAEVTLFTRNAAKSQDAYRLGASKIIVSTDPEQMAAAAGSFDLILDTVPTQHDLKPYIPTLKIDGTLVLVGLIGDITPSISSVPLLVGRRSIAGSFIGGIKETQEMLDFCGEHGITADVEMIEMEQINQAFERLHKSDVKYRFVIDVKKWAAKAA